MPHLKTFLDSLVKSEQPKGPAPAFTPVHIIKSLLIIDSEHSIGRIALSKRLRIGEGSVRTIIKKMVEKGIITVDSIGGCTLTASGASIISELKAILIKTTPFDLAEMDIDAPCYAIHVRSSIEKIPLTRLRDLAVRNGADGMVILSYSANKFSFPLMSEDLSVSYPGLELRLRKAFTMREGDSVLVGFSKINVGAEDGTFATALAILNA